MKLLEMSVSLFAVSLFAQKSVNSPLSMPSLGLQGAT